MCTHQRTVFNRYTGQFFLAKCGKCKACLQEKAYKRAYRIKCEYSPDKIGLFVTLTYDRCSCPFVYQEDIDKRLDILPIYREITSRRVRVVTRSGKNLYLDRRKFELTKLDEIYFPDYDSLRCRTRLRKLAYRYNEIGVCYYPDLQLFKKRLNINLKRKYNYENDYKIYSCSEYGSRSGRPHFHLLIFIRPEDETLFRTAISEAWPFASHRRTEKYIELARDCANYIASYVNCGSNLHPFLSQNFKTKHSYSKDFGMADKLFSFSSVLEKIGKRDFSYLRAVGEKGKESYIRVSIPKYVVNRYFPVFKGYSRLNDFEVLDILRSYILNGSCKVSHYQSTPLISFSKLDQIDYSKDDFYKFSVRLYNAFIKFCRDTSRLNNDFPIHSIDDYILLYREAWKIYKSTILRLWYDDLDTDPKYKYDNTQALRGGLLYSPDTLDYLNKTSLPYIDNPNEYPACIARTIKYASIYDFRNKEKKINNFVMANNNYFF